MIVAPSDATAFGARVPPSPIYPEAGTRDSSKKIFPPADPATAHINCLHRDEVVSALLGGRDG